MSLKVAMQLAHAALNAANAPHAIIGGMALSVLGYPRATNDVDFLVHSDFRGATEEQMRSRGFQLEFSSDEVAQWNGEAPIDFLYANRAPSRDMLKRAIQNSRPVTLLGIPVLDASDIIGLKIQAYSNNPRRLLQDLADIQKLMETNQIDWQRVQTYAEAFNEWERISSLRAN
jgi:hypothetical protein